MSVNKVILVGRLGQDPVVKNVGDQQVANFSVATSEKWKDKAGNAQEKTEWSRIVVWGKLAGVAGQYLKKGREVYVEGKLATRSWEKDGKTSYTTEIIAHTIQFLGGNGGAQNGDPGATPPAVGAPPHAGAGVQPFTEDDGIPF